MLKQLELFFAPLRPSQTDGLDLLHLGARSVPVRWIRNEAARRYILRIANDGSARVTIPRRGSMKAAREFVQRHLAWIEKQLQKRNSPSAHPAAWVDGTEFLFRGENTILHCAPDLGRAQFADQWVEFAAISGNVRPAIERHLRKLAAAELVPRTWELASLHQVTISRVTVRNQRSRWGSCSLKRTISLNWRLIQAPAFVADYIILHELMHLREMNHSPRFWRQVKQVCPDYGAAESWLKQHGELLR